MIEIAVEVAKALIKRFEGCILTPYLCPAGAPTIGYGSTEYLDGSRVALTDPPISLMIAEGLLVGSVQRRYLPAVLHLCPGVDDPNRLAALIDFTYNLGASHLKSSTLRRRVIAGDWDAVPDELRKWTLCAGKRLNGLAKRREAEAALI